jgi:hypothetical protein
MAYCLIPSRCLHLELTLPWIARLVPERLSLGMSIVWVFCFLLRFDDLAEIERDLSALSSRNGLSDPLVAGLTSSSKQLRVVPTCPSMASQRKELLLLIVLGRRFGMLSLSRATFGECLAICVHALADLGCGMIASLFLIRITALNSAVLNVGQFTRYELSPCFSKMTVHSTTCVL